MKRFKFKIIKNNAIMPFLYRLSFYLKNGSIKLHLITGDDSEVFHTHPWDFTSLILFGGYKEYVKIDPDTSTQDIIRHYIMPKTLKFYRRTFSVNKKLHTTQHRVELFKLCGIKIPTLTIGFYSNKIELCSFCKELGYCKSNSKPKENEISNTL